MLYQLIYKEITKDYSENVFSQGIFDSFELVNCAKADFIKTHTQYCDGVEKQRKIEKLQNNLSIVTFQLNRQSPSRL